MIVNYFIQHIGKLIISFVELVDIKAVDLNAKERAVESSKTYKKRSSRKIFIIIPNYVLAPQVNIAYRDGEMVHPKQSFAKNTEYFDVINFISDEINWERMEKVETDNYDIEWNNRTLIDSKEFSYFFFNDDGTYETLSGILEEWYRPLIQNIMAISLSIA